MIETEMGMTKDVSKGRNSKERKVLTLTENKTVMEEDRIKSNKDRKKNGDKVDNGELK